jgi:hypothetical protein
MHSGKHSQWGLRKNFAGCLPRLPTVGCLPWAAYRGCLPWLPTVVAYRGCLPWLPTVVAYRGCLPWLPTVVAYPAPRSGHPKTTQEKLPRKYLSIAYTVPNRGYLVLGPGQPKRYKSIVPRIEAYMPYTVLNIGCTCTSAKLVPPNITAPGLISCPRAVVACDDN